MQENTGDTCGTPAVLHPQFFISLKITDKFDTPISHWQKEEIWWLKTIFAGKARALMFFTSGARDRAVYSLFCNMYMNTFFFIFQGKAEISVKPFLVKFQI